MNLSIDDLKNTGCFNDIDIHLADFLSAAGGINSPVFHLTVMMLSSRLNSGDVCLSLDDVAGKPLSLFFGDGADGSYRDIIIPEKSELLGSLENNKAVGREGNYLPLILDAEDKLYFQKYYSFENSLAEYITGLAGSKSLPADISNVKETFSLLFPSNTGDTDWQSAAAYSALSGGLTVISGGPGTGKTSTVVKILALIAEAGIKSGKEILISLAAPTGKAAARLREAVNIAIAGLPVSDDVKKVIPSETFTIHRLLGSIKDSHEFRHNSENPLMHDVVVVDECSMGDMALMCRLVRAVRPGAQLILLGDKDQLSSVEGGAVFGDLCGGVEGVYTKSFLDTGNRLFGINFPQPVIESGNISVMNDALVVLKKSYRFSGRSGIGILAELVKKGDASGALDILNDESYPDVKFADGTSRKEIGNIYSDAASRVVAGMDCSVEEKISALISSFSILTATRKGELGAEGMNSMAEGILFHLGVIEPVEKFYHGRPVMISRNDYSLSLFNGDIGITSNKGIAEVVFPGPDGKPRTVHPSRLPEHETAFAMTIHKSQGSEFNNVLVVMPDKWNMVMTRELLYTAVTRARNGVVIAAGSDIVKEMILTPTKRMSGLRKKLWGAT
ncbi:MAG TPA: exodeoxyribonuclease V subunit alpha [Spirochaetota bacterium]|nr:exodeoxyribonuclease V subunit alpha [Spirochaetota bacterium]HPS87964.1 exodeoxyribonuclease V subunit alpha [Spirochaetota bacterium]